MLDDISDLQLAQVRFYYLGENASPEDRLIHCQNRLSEITDLLLKEIFDHDQTRTERDMLAKTLAQRPSAEAIWSAMTAKADEAGAIHADDMLAILRTVGGHA